MLRILYFTALLCIGCVSLRAEASQWGLQYSSGVVALRGDLGSDSGRLFHDFQIKTPSLTNESGSIEAYLAIDVLSFKAANQKTAFPFPQSDLRFLNFLFIANLCPMANADLDFCLGLGQGTVNINSPSERRDFGSWNYQTLLRYRANPNWTAHIIAKYVGQVEQSVQGQPSAFGFFALGAGISRSF